MLVNIIRNHAKHLFARSLKCKNNWIILYLSFVNHLIIFAWVDDNHDADSWIVLYFYESTWMHAHMWFDFLNFTNFKINLCTNYFSLLPITNCIIFNKNKVNLSFNAAFHGMPLVWTEFYLLKYSYQMFIVGFTMSGITSCNWETIVLKKQNQRKYKM